MECRQIFDRNRVLWPDFKQPIPSITEITKSLSSGNRHVFLRKQVLDCDFPDRYGTHPNRIRTILDPFSGVVWQATIIYDGPQGNVRVE
ncbi:hypothetical protein SBBP2_1270021 [Burkholderiales bacterium]|nr:hypothetical protein SBBP2_1270021 [Burkholderiales bacterium]